MVVDVKRPILSVSRLMDRGIETFIQAGKQILRRFDGATVELTRRGGLFVLQCQAVVPMLLAPVDEEPAGEAPGEELERELMGREEWNRQLRSKFRHPMSQPVKSGGIMDLHLCHINLGATYVSELAGEKTDMCHDHKTSQAHPSSNATTAS